MKNIYRHFRIKKQQEIASHLNDIMCIYSLARNVSSVEEAVDMYIELLRMEIEK